MSRHGQPPIGIVILGGMDVDPERVKRHREEVDKNIAKVVEIQFGGTYAKKAHAWMSKGGDAESVMIATMVAMMEQARRLERHWDVAQFPTRDKVARRQAMLDKAWDLYKEIYKPEEGKADGGIEEALGRR